MRLGADVNPRDVIPGTLEAARGTTRTAKQI
jgi:hypothetical protein